MTRTTIDRLAVKTLDQRFRHELETGFEIPPRVAQGILNLAKEVFGLDSSVINHFRIRPGQVQQVVAAASALHGPPLAQTDMVTITWTIDAGEEDLAVLKEHGHVARRHRSLENGRIHCNYAGPASGRRPRPNTQGSHRGIVLEAIYLHRDHAPDSSFQSSH